MATAHQNRLYVGIPATGTSSAPRLNGGTRTNNRSSYDDPIKHHTPVEISPQRTADMIPKYVNQNVRIGQSIGGGFT